TVLKKLKLLVTGDIGCYTLGAAPPLSALHTCLCMGSGITFFEGFRRALGKNVVGVIGDSTFVHTGVSGFINLSYNKTKGLVVILDNGTTAMTGNQPHPATGVTAKGEQTRRLKLEEIVRACGAENVDVIDPHNLKEMEVLVRARVEADALSVIIARSPCMLIAPKKLPPPRYDKEKCKSCYLCLQIECPALTKAADGGIVLHRDICGGCNLCVEVCAPKALLGHA
ncbi:MAG: thiamine pyrophosphate-dependent enzyme, partial [Candidatus Omnitrophica bacterium]|nr:thiamine pyrophosphate-dependent enzyme [Candidatus Omnitrophota bacterium]